MYFDLYFMQYNLLLNVTTLLMGLNVAMLLLVDPRHSKKKPASASDRLYCHGVVSPQCHRHCV